MSEHLIEGVCLHHRSRKSIEDEARNRVSLAEPLTNEVRHQVVADEPSTRECGGDLHSERRARPHCGTKDFPGRDMGNAVSLSQPDGLGTLARPGRADQDQVELQGGVCPVGWPDELIAAVPEQRSIPEHDGPSTKAWCRWP